MFNICDSKFVKVWDIEIKERYISADLSTSKKEKDGTYTNSNYKFCKFVGGAFDMAKLLHKGDTITIDKGAIGKRKGKDGKLWDEVVIFEFTVTKTAEGFAPDDNTDDLPWE